MGTGVAGWSAARSLEICGDGAGPSSQVWQFRKRKGGGRKSRPLLTCARSLGTGVAGWSAAAAQVCTQCKYRECADRRGCAGLGPTQARAAGILGGDAQQARLFRPAAFWNRVDTGVVHIGEHDSAWHACGAPDSLPHPVSRMSGDFEASALNQMAITCRGAPARRRDLCRLIETPALRDAADLGQADPRRHR